MNMTYVYAKKIIENGTYRDKNEFVLKLDIFLMGGRINQEEYTELVGMLPTE